MPGSTSQASEGPGYGGGQSQETARTSLDGAAQATETSMRSSENTDVANDFSFWAGCWLAESEAETMVNNLNRKPLTYSYCFDEKGTAEVIIDEKDSQGQQIGTCRTTATSSFNDRDLLIVENKEPDCGDGRTYYPSVVTCRPGEGDLATCEIVQRKDGGELSRKSLTFHRAALDRE